MPADALPIPHDLPVPGAVNYTRTYLDPLGRPLIGSVTFTGEARSATVDAVILPAPVSVPVTAGVLSVNLPPGIYQLRADLRTVDGAPVVDTDRIAVKAP